MRHLRFILTVAVLMMTQVMPAMAQVEPNPGTDNAIEGQSKSRAAEQNAQTPAADNYQQAQTQPDEQSPPQAEPAGPAQCTWAGGWWDDDWYTWDCPIV